MKTIKENWKVALIVAAGVVAVILLCVFGIQSAQNRAFSLDWNPGDPKRQKVFEHTSWTPGSILATASHSPLQRVMWPSVK